MPEILTESDMEAFMIAGAQKYSEDNKMNVLIAVSKVNAVEASNSSQNAVDWTLKMITEISRRTAPINPITYIRLTFIHVEDIAAVSTGAGDSLLSGADDEAEQLDPVWQHFRDQCLPLGIECEWVQRTGDNPAKEICSQVEPANVLILGNSGLSCFQRFSLENVAEYCAKNATCNVYRVKLIAELQEGNQHLLEGNQDEQEGNLDVQGNQDLQEGNLDVQAGNQDLQEINQEEQEGNEDLQEANQNLQERDQVVPEVNQDLQEGDQIVPEVNQDLQEGDQVVPEGNHDD